MYVYVRISASKGLLVVVVVAVVVVVVTVIKACSNPWLGFASIFRNRLRLRIPSYLVQSTCGPI